MDETRFGGWARRLGVAVLMATMVAPGMVEAGDDLGGVEVTTDAVGDVTHLVTFGSVAERDAQLDALVAVGARLMRVYETTPVVAVAGSPIVADRVRALPGVVSVGVDAEVVSAAAEWNLDRIDQDELPLDGRFAPVGDGAGVRIYVVDTGVNGSHDEFVGRVAAGWDGIGEGSGPLEDCDGHGTHVAGLAAGRTFGVASAATVVPVKVLGCDGSGNSSVVLAGFDWIVAEQAKLGVPAVVNVSFGTAQTVPSLNAGVEMLVAAGLPVVVSAGNVSLDACGSSPAQVDVALTVAASSRDDEMADFSNFGSCMDVFAPGDRVRSAGRSSASATALYSGTSMAAPHVAGAAALALSESPGLSPGEVFDRVVGGATDGVLVGELLGSPNRLLRVDSLPVAPSDTDPVVPSDPDPVVPSDPVPSSVAFVGETPRRIADTRAAQGSFPRGTLRSGDTLRLDVGGSEPAALNVTAVAATGGGHLSVYPCSTGFTGTSSLNFAAGRTVANNVPASPDADGFVCVRAFVAGNGQVDVVVDQAGRFSRDGGFRSVAPDRVFDSRTTGRKVSGGGTVRLSGFEPGRAAVLNVTVTQPDGSGHVTAWPCNQERPNSSVSNYAAGVTRAASVIVESDSAGEVCLWTFAATHLIVDVSGSFDVDNAEFINPVRVLDTRPAHRIGSSGMSRSFSVTFPRAAGRAVALNVTAVLPTAAGHVTVWPCSERRPTASVVNYQAGETAPNSVVIQPDSAGRVCFYSHASTHLVVDHQGYLNAGG